jgi:hypothetical protein
MRAVAGIMGSLAGCLGCVLRLWRCKHRRMSVVGLAQGSCLRCVGVTTHTARPGGCWWVPLFVAMKALQPKPLVVSGCAGQEQVQLPCAAVAARLRWHCARMTPVGGVGVAHGGRASCKPWRTVCMPRRMQPPCSCPCKGHTGAFFADKTPRLPFLLSWLLSSVWRANENTKIDARHSQNARDKKHSALGGCVWGVWGMRLRGSCGVVPPVFLCLRRTNPNRATEGRRHCWCTLLPSVTCVMSAPGCILLSAVLDEPSSRALLAKTDCSGVTGAPMHVCVCVCVRTCAARLLEAVTATQ